LRLCSYLAEILAPQQETPFARIALASLVASFANGGVIKDKAAE